MLNVLVFACNCRSVYFESALFLIKKQQQIINEGVLFSEASELTVCNKFDYYSNIVPFYCTIQENTQNMRTCYIVESHRVSNLSLNKTFKMTGK